MEFNGCDQASLIGELTQGMELAKQLKAHMSPEVSDQAKVIMVEKIVASYEKALLILKWGGSIEQSHQHVVPSTTTMPGSPLSVIGSPKSEDLNPGFNNQQDGRDFSRKRKMMPSWTEQVKLSSDNGLEGPPDDGYSWRKYGQKDILGTKHPRSYYRCTYRNIQGCCAIKQVQRNDEDPMVFDITYKGRHTCKLVPRSKSTPTSPEKQVDNNQRNFAITDYQQQPDMVLNFQTGLTVDTQDVENQGLGFPFPTRVSGYENLTFTPSMLDDCNFYSGFPQPFIPSPANSESNYFSASQCKMNTFGGVHQGQNSESDITDIISATTSGTNSPIIGIDFPFDDHAFFSSFFQAKE